MRTSKPRTSNRVPSNTVVVASSRARIASSSSLEWMSHSTLVTTAKPSTENLTTSGERSPGGVLLPSDRDDEVGHRRDERGEERCAPNLTTRDALVELHAEPRVHFGLVVQKTLGRRNERVDPRNTARLGDELLERKELLLKAELARFHVDEDFFEVVERPDRIVERPKSLNLRAEVERIGAKHIEDRSEARHRVSRLVLEARQCRKRVSRLLKRWLARNGLRLARALQARDRPEPNGDALRKSLEEIQFLPEKHARLRVDRAERSDDAAIDDDREPSVRPHEGVADQMRRERRIERGVFHDDRGSALDDAPTQRRGTPGRVRRTDIRIHADRGPEALRALEDDRHERHRDFQLCRNLLDDALKLGIVDLVAGWGTDGMQAKPLLRARRSFGDARTFFVPAPVRRARVAWRKSQARGR